MGKYRSYEASWRSGEPAVATEATNEDVNQAKIAVHEAFQQHRGDLRMVSSTAQVMQEEAIAYLLADLLGYELLPGEAFAIGEEARCAHRDYKGKPRKGKPADQRIKDVASTKASKARSAAAKSAELAANLEQRLEEIEAVLRTDRRELACKVVSLSWPARNSVIRTAAPAPASAPAPAPVEAAPADEVAAACAVTAAARKAMRAAFGKLCDAKVEKEKAEKALARLGPDPSLQPCPALEFRQKRLAQLKILWQKMDDAQQVFHAYGREGIGRKRVLKLGEELVQEAEDAKAAWDAARAAVRAHEVSTEARFDTMLADSSARRQLYIDAKWRVWDAERVVRDAESEDAEAMDAKVDAVIEEGRARRRAGEPPPVLPPTPPTGC